MPRKLVETFNVEYLQILDEAGNLDKKLDPEIPVDDLRQLYRAMLTARMLDRRMYNLQQQGRIGTFPGVAGQEAGCLGCVYALRPDDWLQPAFRETSALFWRGTSIKTILVYYTGTEAGNLLENPKDLPIAITIGSQTAHAVGIGMAAKIRGDDAVVMVFFGDGATSEGDVHEAFNMAGVFQTPVIFVCVNNQYAISIPCSQQTHSKTFAQKAIAYGFPGMQVDGNDLLASYVAAREAVDRARNGGGPSLIECLTYRIGPHTTADDPRRYRTEAEVEAWQKKDPLVRFRVYLERKNLWKPEWQQELEDEIKAEIDDALSEAEAEAAHVDSLEMFDHVYEEKTPELQAQKEQAAEFVEEQVPAT